MKQYVCMCLNFLLHWVPNLLKSVERLPLALVCFRSVSIGSFRLTAWTFKVFLESVPLLCHDEFAKATSQPSPILCTFRDSPAAESWLVNFSINSILVLEQTEMLDDCCWKYNLKHCKNICENSASPSIPSRPLTDRSCCTSFKTKVF